MTNLKRLHTLTARELAMLFYKMSVTGEVSICQLCCPKGKCKAKYPTECRDKIQNYLNRPYDGKISELWEAKKDE